MLETYNTSISTRRLTETSWEKDYTANLSGVDAFIMADDEAVQENEFGNPVYSVHTMLTEDWIDIIESDEVTDANGVVYSVKWVLRHNTFVWAHMQYIITKARGT